jgi:hypothetical protein
MRLLIALAALLTALALCFADDTTSPTNSDTVLREKLFQRFLVEMGEVDITTNRDQSYTNMMKRIFDEYVIDPSFGLRWDEVPAPTSTGSNAMAAVWEFVAANGWNMETNGSQFFDYPYHSDHIKSIRGLPWKAIKDRDFEAVTHEGVLYVLLDGWHHDLSGVAYNPNTNTFAPYIRGFQPIGQHWYVWAQPEDPITLKQKYEGQKP